MTCYYPLSGFIVKDFLGEKGKNHLIIKPYKTTRASFAGKDISDTWFPVPCGHCLGCKMEQAQAWTVRLQLEASLYPDELNHFITLTYDEAHNPVSLIKKDVQKFMKRLRHTFGECRFFLCGEYGSTTARPHYHLLLFGCNIPDLRPHLLTDPDGLYISKTLDKIWKFGNCIVGKVTQQSIGYTARYTVKKLASDREHKEMLNRIGLTPEFILMSRKPGIGAAAFKKEWFEWNYIPLNGRKYPINRFYIDMFKKMGYSYDPIKDYMSRTIDIDFKKYGDIENYYNELKNRDIVNNERLKILKKRNLDQYGID